MNKEWRIIINNLIVPLTIIVFLLSACSDNEQVIGIEDKGSASLLFIQKVENNTSSEEMTRMVKDKQEVEQVLTMVEGVEVKKTIPEEIMDKMESTDTYMFVFSVGEELQTGEAAPYAFYALENGTFVFLYSDFNSPQEPLITTERHQGLLDDIKHLFGIEF